MEGLNLEKIERQIEELAKHSIDWRFLFAVLVPVSVTVGGSLISIAIQVNTMSERLSSLNQAMQTANTSNRHELDMVYKRLEQLERPKNAKE